MAIFKETKKNKKGKEKEPVEVLSKTVSRHQKPALFMKQPWVTEKAGDLSVFGKYIFIVDRKINKSEIKKAVESIYSVKVEDVNIINIKGKAKRLGRSLGRTSAVKKAVVTLKKGQKIDIMPT